ncbi:MAG: class I SAM-dependent methyltransferase [Gemmatimonas sp.]
MDPKPMYSSNWFETFAPNVESSASPEVAAISALCRRPEFSRLLEIGCGTGRVAGPLVSLGYDVVGIDINEDALRVAEIQAPGPKYIVLDQRDVAQLPRTFDAALLLWNSIGFRSRANDEHILRGVATVLRPGGKFLIDLYHPEWLADQSTMAVKSRGATVRRWLSDGRCFHAITYDDGRVDDIQFNVYMPDEIGAMLARAGFAVNTQMTWWNTDRAPSRARARYQLECVRV